MNSSQAIVASQQCDPIGLLLDGTYLPADAKVAVRWIRGSTAGLGVESGRIAVEVDGLAAG